ncbi:hypothetical protein JOM49_003112 [Amycolatopsis magusensis]|uniref:Winged helix DNA-binding domain-containing protein n=1 Tax=Amycolatopsis magusensis TaxID=882444 RepID=A0ABS4PSK1_9PSEU|nr:hypothetical protein [Amycolatopsis magusensis]
MTSAERAEVVTPETTQLTQQITHRARAMLRAVQAGRAELTASCEPDLRVDGLHCSDQATSHQLARAGLIRAAGPALPGSWVRAELTPAGLAALARPIQGYTHRRLSVVPPLPGGTGNPSAA